MSDLVISIGAKYAPLVYERYLMSLRNAGFTGEIAVLLQEADLSHDVVGIFSRYQARPVAYPGSRFLEVSLRFPLFLELLSQFHPQCSDGYVLHTDLRDVIFQADPFTHRLARRAEFSFALEEGVIGACRFNSAWIEGAFGAEMLGKLSEMSISCAGTSLGSFEAMRYYLQRMSEIIFSRCDRDGPSSDTLNDQGVHNYLMHHEGLGACTMQSLGNESGLFMNIGLMRAVVLNTRGELLSNTGEPAHVVHQLDRLPPAALLRLQEQVPYRMDDLVRASVEREVVLGVREPIAVETGMK